MKNFAAIEAAIDHESGTGLFIDKNLAPEIDSIAVLMGAANYYELVLAAADAAIFMRGILRK